MALNASQIRAVERALISGYGKDNVNYYPIKKLFRISLNEPNPAERIKQLKRIRDSLKDYGAVYNVPANGTGAVVCQPISIECKAIEASNSPDLRPGNISPSIINKWLTAEEIVDNVKLHLKKMDLAKESNDQILKVLNGTLKDTNVTIPFEIDKSLLPAEFYEILTAVKLAKLLSHNDRKIRQVLGIPPKMDLTHSKIKIKLPKSANYPLIDYFINIQPGEMKDEESSLKISVKSKVRGNSTNSVKFKDVFRDEYDLKKWWSDMSPTMKNDQKGQYIVAESAMHVYKGGYSGQIVAVIPMIALTQLLKRDKYKIQALIKRLGTGKKVIDVDVLESVVIQVLKQTSKFNYKTELHEILNDKGELMKISQMINSNLGDKTEINVYNLSYFCERILVASSARNTPTEYNFYQMFFDEVLTKKRVAYAVTELKNTGNKTVALHYGYYSLINFAKEYDDWIKLKSKGAPNRPADALGLDI